MGKVCKLAFSAVGFLLILFVSLPVLGQDEEDIFGIDRKLRSRTRKSESDLGNVFRNIMGSFSFEFGPGMGYHYNRLDFRSAYPSEYPITSVITDTPTDINPTDTLGFRGGRFGYPLQAGVKLNLFDLLIIGGGIGREWGNMSSLKLEDYRFNFENETYTFDKLYGSVGLVLYDAGKRISFLNWKYRKFSASNHYMQSERKLRIQQEYPWRFIVDAEFGRLYPRNQFDSRISIDQPFYSFGLRIEREFSEYTKMFIRPSLTIREFTYDRSADLMEAHLIKQQLFAIQVGAAISLPSTKRCKVAGCGVVMKHMHNGVEYRGSSIWKRQNRKIGQWYGN